MNNLDGLVSLITGASGGIGREIATRLATDGSDLALHYNTNKKSVEEIAKIATKLGRRVSVLQADVSNAIEADQLLEQTVTALGKIDVLINNAGITKDNLAIRLSESDWDDVIATNLKSAFLCSRTALKYMIRQRSGRIINMASVVGLTGNPGQANYTAAKAGLIGLTKTLALEVASRGITVNALAPGFISTPMTSDLPKDYQEAIIARIPMGRFGTPEDVASAVSFLASDNASYITGQVIAVDGGLGR